MSRFLDGPAAGVHLNLGRAPIMLRAVVNRAGKWDALDAPDDDPGPTETVYVYIAVHGTGFSGIVCTRGRGGGGGCFNSMDYRLLDPQPDPGHVRDRVKWAAWCEENKELLLATHQRLALPKPPMGPGEVVPVPQR